MKRLHHISLLSSSLGKPKQLFNNRFFSFVNKENANRRTVFFHYHGGKIFFARIGKGCWGHTLNHVNSTTKMQHLLLSLVRIVSIIHALREKMSQASASLLYIAKKVARFAVYISCFLSGLITGSDCTWSLIENRLPAMSPTTVLFDGGTGEPIPAFGDPNAPNASVLSNLNANARNAPSSLFPSTRQAMD